MPHSSWVIPDANDGKKLLRHFNRRFAGKVDACMGSFSESTNVGAMPVRTDCSEGDLLGFTKLGSVNHDPTVQQSVEMEIPDPSTDRA